MTINLPTSWNDITLSMFDKICRIKPSSRDYSYELVKTVTNLTDEEITSIPMTDYLSLVNRLAWMNQYPPVNKVPKDTITLNNVEYSVMMHPNKMTASQFLDYRYLLINDESELKQAKLMAIFIVPKGSSYNDGSYDFDELVKIIWNDLPIEYALGLSTFFVTVSTCYLQCSLASSAREIKKLIKREKDLLIKEKLKETLMSMKIMKDNLKKTIMEKNERIRALMKPIGNK